MNDLLGDRGLEAFRAAIDRRSWPEAASLGEALDRAGQLEPKDLERFAKAVWWTGDAQRSIGLRERAYATHVERGDAVSAAFAALTLRREHHAMNESATAAGWLQRAERLLSDVPEGPAHGYLAVALGQVAWASGRLDDARTAMDRAATIGQRNDDRDLQAWSRMYEGMLLVALGRVEEGMSLIDEVSAAAAGGELGAYTTGAVFCNTIETCRDLADYRRAAEWSNAAKRWCERQAIAGFPGICRVRRAEVLRRQGDWEAAEHDAVAACQELAGFAPHHAGEAFHELGEVRLRLGDLAGAEEAFQRSHELGADPQPGLALLMLAQGKSAAAATALARTLDDVGTSRLARARILPAVVEVAYARRDAASAAAAAAELTTIAREFGAPGIQASADVASGMAALLAGSPDAAAAVLRPAARAWRELDAPYDVARTRMLLGQAYAAAGDRDGAILELRAAAARFQELGATADARGAAAEVERLEATTDRASRVARTFMFTDIVGSTSLIEAIGDDSWDDLRRWHDVTLRACVAEHDGEEVDHAGDGFFVAFATAEAAVGCAIHVQRTLAAHRRTSGFAPQVRIGLHAAEATRSDEGYAGRGVHEAARIGALAGGGRIVASALTVDGLDGIRTSEPRQAALKGIAEPVIVVDIDWQAESGRPI